MATTDNNPAATVNVVGPTVEHPVFRSSPTRGWSSPSLADDEAYSLGSPGNDAAGIYLCSVVGSPEKSAIFSITAASGAVTAVTELVDWNTAWAADGTTNAMYHLYDTSGEVFLENTNTAAAVLTITRLS